MEVKKDIVLRTYLLYTLVSFLGLAICGRVFYIQHMEGNKWEKEEANFSTSFRTIEAVRGNIYAEDGSLLATSLPYFDVAMDVNTEYMTDDIFNSNVDSLSACLSSLFKDKTGNEYYKILKTARDNGERYVMIHHSVSYDDLQKLKRFPLIRLGKYKGGLIVDQNNRRELPFRDLAERTIGYERENVQPVGLEGAYDSYLAGVNGQGLMTKTAGGVWVPLNNEENLQPQNGCDLISTINVNYQDVAENALRTQLIKHRADHGCVVLMEVKTGRVLAIANLTRRDSSDTYEEMYNYATGESMEPGSTFKLFSLLVAMEDGLVNPTDTVNLEGGQHTYYDRTMKDAEHNDEESTVVNVQRAFELSSNVGISKVIYKHYATQPEKFVDGLCRLGINQPLHLTIPGEGEPMIPNPGDKHWYGTTLPWLSVGYGLTITPLQTLTVYNAVANNGVMVKPQLEDAITKDGKVVKKFEPIVMNPAICSSSTLKKLRKMLEGVVLRGTASNLKNTVYSIAGKTGTAQIASKGQYKVEAKADYRASFVGYFPAENPEYSCIVIVNSPGTDGYYGNITAGPIFREIADKVYASSIGIDPSVNDTSHKAINNNLFVKNGNADDTYKVFKTLDLKCKTPLSMSPWVAFGVQDSTLIVNAYNPQKQLEKGIMPDLRNMNAEDAVYLLENAHLKVSVKGSGAVKEQSLEPGTNFAKGQKNTIKAVVRVEKILKDILYKVALTEVIGTTDISISSVQFDSRKVKEDCLFIAVKGLTVDGHNFIDQTIKNGATAIICEEFPEKKHRGITYLKVKDSGEALGIIASSFYDAPSSKLKLVGITGTNGKTTTATLLYKLFRKLGYKVGLLSTVQNKINDRIYPATHTTPDALELNKMLSEMLAEGCTHCFMEVSSHAVVQKRIVGLTFAGAVFTNITHDHLDFHKTFDEYIKAKKKFFDDLPSSAFALVNKDDSHGLVMLQNTKATKKTFALKNPADYKCKIIENTFSGLDLTLDNREVWIKLIGAFNAYNALGIYATAILLGENKEETLKALSTLDAVEGRFQYTKAPNGTIGVVDYAHTPDALNNVLSTLHDVRANKEKIITVVGCGGDRDKTKRPIMASIACEKSDKVILTSDNPRSEDPADIIHQMEKGLSLMHKKKSLSIADRKEAIKTACQLAQRGDIILLAGKGHEKYQEIKGVKYPFDDMKILTETLNLLQS